MSHSYAIQAVARSNKKLAARRDHRRLARAFQSIAGNQLERAFGHSHRRLPMLGLKMNVTGAV
jgi:hypothetical protein